MQNLMFKIHDAEMMLDVSVILLSAVMYWICLIPSIELIMIAWSILSKTWLAVVSAKLLPCEIFFEGLVSKI